MTQLRKYRDAISNYFDELTRGIGKRDSSFMDVDAVSHDKDTHRFLFQEFKQEGESLHPAQRMVLRDLAGLPRCTVWFVRRIEGGLIGWAEFGSGRLEEIITEADYCERFRCWWSDQKQEQKAIATSAPIKLLPIPHPRDSVPMMTADEINWGFGERPKKPSVT